MAENPKKHGVLDRIVCIGTAIDSPAVRQALHCADAATQCAVVAQRPEDLTKMLADRKSRWAYLRFVPTRRQVQAAHAAGKKVIVVGPTVMGRETANWIRAREAGADAVLTDYPLDLRRAWRGDPATPR